MFHITNHWGNVDQNYNEIPSHTQKGGYYKKKKKRKRKLLTRMGSNLNPFALMVGMQNGTAAAESRMEVPQKINELPYNPTIPYLGICPKRLKAGSLRYIFMVILIATLFTIAKT